MGRKKNEVQKEKFHLAMSPAVHKKLRYLAVEYDAYPGEIIEGLIEFAERMTSFPPVGQIPTDFIGELFGMCLRSASSDREVKELLAVDMSNPAAIQEYFERRKGQE